MKIKHFLALALAVPLVTCQPATANASQYSAYQELKHGEIKQEAMIMCRYKKDFLKVRANSHAENIVALEYLGNNGLCWFVPGGTKYIRLDYDYENQVALIVVKRIGDVVPQEGWTHGVFFK